MESNWKSRKVVVIPISSNSGGKKQDYANAQLVVIRREKSKGQVKRAWPWSRKMPPHRVDC